MIPLARVLQVCEGALDRDGDARRAYLDETCGDDSDLRRDVDALLTRRDDSGDGFLSTPPWQDPLPALAPGQRLGPYEVVGPLGAGGMGAVFKARDTRLGRIVALKVIGGGAIDAAMRERFTREARAIAAISHPNICAIYDIGREVPSPGGTGLLDFLVIEYLEGMTLAERVAQGPLPFDEAVHVAVQIADALAAAHRTGIIHGDLKPANIMLSSTDGSVAKLLDFGLAELAPARTGGRSQQHRGAATLSPAIAGTPPYMAPEQLQGHARDARTDMFAFGCVLHEMITGQRAFAGETDAGVLSAVLTREPPAASALQPLTPPALDRLITRCLAKDPNDRCESALDAADELRKIESESRPRASRSRTASWLWRAAGAIAILGSAIAWGASRVRTPAAIEPRTLVLPVRDGVDLGPAQNVEFAVDGRAIVYVGVRHGVPALYWQDLGEPDARMISGSESPGQRFVTPFVSPDGAWLGFVRGDTLVKIPIRAGRTTGPAIVLAQGMGWMRGASWGDGGAIVYCPNPYGGLWLASPDGGTPRELTRPDPARSELSHRWPQVLPGGRAALFTIQDASGRQDRSVIAVVELKSGRITRLVQGGSYGRYAPDGHLVYARNGSLFAVPFDLASLTVTGQPVSVVSGVSMESAGSGSAKFAISRTGALIYEPSPPRPASNNSLIWVDRDGQVEAVTGEQRSYLGVITLSPDGRRLIVRIEDPARLDSQLWSYNIPARRWRQLTSQADNSAPVLSPDGTRLVFSSNRDGAFNLYTMPADGGAVERLTRSSQWQYASSFSPDGRFLLYQQSSGAGMNTEVLSLHDRSTWRWGPENVNLFGATFSPDGRWIAYQSGASGRTEVYVAPFDAPEQRLRVSRVNGGSAPLWSPDGRSLYYLDGSSVMVARVQTGPRLQASTPHVAFPLPYTPVVEGATNVIALTPDERRLITVQPDPARAPRAERLLLTPNWIEELRARVPPGR